MDEAYRVLRSSVYAFCHGYHFFVSIAALFALPVSASILLSQTYITYSPFSLHLITSRFHSLFHAAGFPASSKLFSILSLMLSQTIFSTILTLPFTFTFLLLAKASIILIIREFPYRKNSPPPFPSLLNLYCPLLLTHLFTSFIILSANASIFALLFLAFSAAELIGLSSTNSLLLVSVAGAVLYSVVIANAVVTCNLAIIVSAMEKGSGYLPVLKACMLIRGRVATALSVSLFTNLALAAVEALFQYRIMRSYHLSSKLNSSIVGEAFTIAYMHSVLTVLEIIGSCFFYRSCKPNCGPDWEDSFGHAVEFEPGRKGKV